MKCDAISKVSQVALEAQTKDSVEASEIRAWLFIYGNKSASNLIYSKKSLTDITSIPNRSQRPTFKCHLYRPAIKRTNPRYASKRGRSYLTRTMRLIPSQVADKNMVNDQCEAQHAPAFGRVGTEIAARRMCKDRITSPTFLSSGISLALTIEMQSDTMIVC